MKMRSNPRPVRRPPKKTVVKSSNIVKKKMTAKNKKAENQNVKTKPKIVVSKSKVVKSVVKPLKGIIKSQEKIISKVKAKKILENIDIKDLKSPKKRVQVNKKKINVSETLKKKVEENKTVVKSKEEDTNKKPIDKKTPKVKNVEKTPVKLKKVKKVDEIKPIDASETKDKVINKKVKPIDKNSPSKVVETQQKKKIKKVVAQKEVVSNNKIINNLKLTPSNAKDVKISKINQIKLQKTTKKENVEEIENNSKIVHNKSDIKTVPKIQKPIKVEPKEEPIDEKVLKVIKIEPVKPKVHKVELPKNKVVKSKPKKIKSSPVEKDSDNTDKVIKTEQIDGIMKANKSKDRTKIVKFAKIIKPKSQVKSKIKEEKKIKHECSSGGDEDSRTSDEITLNVLRQHQLKDPKNERKRREEYNRMKKIKTESSESEDEEVKKLPNKRSKALQSKDKKTILKNHSKAKPTSPKIVVLKKRIMKSPGSPENPRMKLFSFWNGPKRHRVASLNALAKVHCLYENESRGAMLEMLKKQRKPASDSDPPPSPPSSRTLRSGPGVRGGVGKHWDVLNAMSSSSEDISEQESSVESTSIEPYKKTSVAEKKDDKSKKEVKKRRNRTEIVMDLKDMVVRKRMASLNATAILAASYSPEKRSSKGGTDLDDSDEDEDDDDDYSETSETVTSDQSKRRCYEPDVKEDGKLIEVRATPNKKKVAVIVNQDTDVTITGVYVNSTTRSTHHLHEGYCSIAGMQYRISATSHTQTNATAVATTETLLHGGVHVPPQPPDHHVVHHGEPQGVGHDHCCTVQSPDSLHSPSTTGAPPPSYTPLSALSSMQPPGAPVSPSGVPPPAPGPPPVQHQPLPSRRPPTCAHGSSAFTAPYMHHHHHHHPHGPAKMEPPPPHLPPPPPPVPVASHHGYIHGYYQPAGPLITTHHTHPPHVAPVALSKPAPVSAPPTAQQPPLSPPSQVSAPAASTSSSNDASSLAADTDVVITDPPQAAPQVSAPPQQQTLPPPPPQSQPPIHAYRYTQSYPQPPSSHPTPAGYPYAYPAQYYTSPPGGSLQYSPQQHYHPQDLCYTAPAPFFHPKAYSSAPPASYHRRYIPAPAQYYTTGPDVYSSSQSQQTSQMVTSSVTASSGHRGGYGPPGGPPPALVEPYPPPPPPGPVSIVEPYPPPPYYTSYGAGPACYSHSPPTRSLPFIDAAYQPCPCPMESCPKNVHTGPLTGDGKRSNMTPIAKESSGMPLPPVALALPLEPASVNGPPSPARGSAGMPPPPSPAGATYQSSSTPKQETTEENKPVEKVRRKARVGKNMVRNTIANFNNNNNNMRQDTLLLMCHNPVVSKEVKRETISPQEDVIVLEKKQDILIEEIKNDMTNNNNNNYKIEHKDTITDLCIKEDLICKDVVTEVKKEVARRLSACKEEIKTDSESEKTEVKSAEVVEEEKTTVVAAKRKLSTETCEEESIVQKKQKLNKNLSSYKDLIKKTNKTCVKINNGKRKLNIDSEKGCPKSYLKFNSPKILLGSKNKKRTGVKRKSPTLTEEPQTKKIKTPKPLAASNLHNAKQNQKSVKLVTEELLLSENLEPTIKINKKTAPSKISKKTAPALLDSLFLKNNVDRTIESVINSVCVEEVVSPPAPPKKCISVIDENVKSDADMFKKPPRKWQSVKTKMEPPKQPIKPILKSENKKKSKTKIVENVIIAAPRIFKKVTPQPKWSNGWSWEGEPFQGKIFLNSDEPLVSRTCYPAMRHKEGDLISPRDCVLLKSGTRKIDLPFVAKVASLWENPDDGEMMMSLLWYYRPEHTEQGRLPTDQPDEVFASRHKDINSVACIEDKCYVLTFNEYCRYRKNARRLEEGLESPGSVVPQAEGEMYPRAHRQPPASLSTSPDMVFFCRRVYDFRQKRIMKNPS